MNLTKLFLDNLNEAIKKGAAATDPKDKSLICSNIALAIAMTGVVTEESINKLLSAKGTNEDKSESLKASAGKWNKKTSKKKQEEVAPVEEVPPVEEEQEDIEVVPVEESQDTEETPQESEVNNEEIEEEWTESAQEKYKEELERLNQYVEAWTEEYVFETCLYEFSEHQFNGKENVRPCNIEAFIAWLDQLAASFEEEQE